MEKRQCPRCKCFKESSNFVGVNEKFVKCCSGCRSYAIEYQNKKKSEDEEAFRSRQKEQNRAYYAENREIMLEKFRAWYDKNREIVLEKQRAWYDKNLEIVLEKQRVWSDKNRTNPKFALKRYKMGAKRRDLEWNLDDEDAMEMMTSPCTYCGILPEDRVNGIDRMDNAVGYVPDNCVPCCETCNFLKACLDPLTFIERCRHIAGVEDRPDAWIDKKYVSYKMYLRNSNKKNKEFAITEEEFQTLTSQACTYCSKQNSATHTNGVDRVDSSRGYTLDNCVPCCGECNVMKKTMSDVEFRDACAAVARHGHVPCVTVTVRQKMCIASRKPSA